MLATDSGAGTQLKQRKILAVMLHVARVAHLTQHPAVILDGPHEFAGLGIRGNQVIH